MNFWKPCFRVFLILSAIINTQIFAIGTVYVSNSIGFVTVIDPNTNAIIATIPVPNHPAQIEVSPNRQIVYVSESAGNAVAVINANSNTLVATIPVGTNPAGLAFTPDGNFAYVANTISNNVSLIDTSTNAVLTTIPLPFTSPTDVAVTPDGRFAYVSGLDEVDAIDTATNTIVARISTPGIDNIAIAITPDGKTAYTSTNNSAVEVIDIASNTLVDSIAQPYVRSDDLAITSDGKSVYVPFFTASTPNVSVIDVATNADVASFTGGLRPVGIALQADLTFGYTANPAFNIVSVFSLSTNTIVANITTAALPVYIAIANINPPGSLTAKAKKDDFALIYEIYNILRWTPSTSPGTTGFNIFRDGVKIATVGPTIFKFKDHNRQKGVTYVYAVTAFDSLGNVSAAATFTIKD